ncbi:hypothetical protein FEF65_12195 [Mariprofundus erugo]|uniref:VWA domain-containing protein n=2 Tax=Mariprofundus erugo TaxID=2528639 RepID=A0A5R9GRE3_9PROT|nr:hypothetical protein FEF65_12195 [Mariprofundus erugo]
MRRQRTSQQDNFYEIFSDMALLMLAAFIFLFALILINAQLQGSGKAEETQQEIADLKKKLAEAKHENLELQHEINNLASVNAQEQLKNVDALVSGKDVQEKVDQVLLSAGMATGKGRKDFDMFVEGLRNLPGKDLHLVVDGTGSMHGVTTFLVPVLRLIAIRSGKHLSAVSWYADRREGTYTGSMGEMFDQLMADAPFVGTDETIGHAFRHIAADSPVPGAYLLIGDEPPTDEVRYHEIPAPVFTLPLGTSNGNTKYAFQKLADMTGGKMLVLKFQ